MNILAIIFYSLISYSSSFIIPNEIPTILSVIYSNIPPLKIGIDTRFGYGFRLGNHADYQTLVEIGPQTNTNPISTNGTLAKRQSLSTGRFQRLYSEALKRTASTTKEPQRKKTGKDKKSQRTIVGNIEFKKVPGIDENTVTNRKNKSKMSAQAKLGSENLSSPVKISLL